MLNLIIRMIKRRKTTKDEFFNIIIDCFELHETKPNKITAIRLCLSPVLYLLTVLLGIYESPILFVLIALFLIAGAISDGLDGRIARRFDRKSRLGKWLDSFADKCFIFCIMFGARTVNPVINENIFWLLFSAESFLFLTGSFIGIMGEDYEKKKNIHLGSNDFGKWKFTTEAVCCFFIFLYIISPDRTVFNIVQFLAILAFSLAILSIIGHLTKKTPL